MDIEEVSARIVASRGTQPAGTQRELLGELTQLYGSLGVLGGGDGVVPSLPRVCSAAAECWKGVASSRHPTGTGRLDARSENGCIFLPWIGPNYQRGGVCVVGTNLRYGGKDWELASEHRIALDPEHGQVPKLRAGKKKVHQSYWAHSTMRDVVAVQRSKRGESSLDCKSGEVLAEALLASARLQTVKCSPIGGLSSPTPAMVEHCPSRYLIRELEVLRPSALLVYGVKAREGVGRLGKVTIEERDERKKYFRRGRVEVSGFSSEVFFLTHPGHGGWHRAHEELIASLRRRGVEVGG